MRVPLDREQMMRINFVGPPQTFPLLPFREVLAGARQNRPLPQLDGAAVLIGVTAGSQQDYHATPYGNNYARLFYSTSPGLMSGPEVHAHTLATLHDRAFITTPWFLHPVPFQAQAQAQQEADMLRMLEAKQHSEQQHCPGRTEGRGLLL